MMRVVGIRCFGESNQIIILLFEGICYGESNQIYYFISLVST